MNFHIVCPVWGESYSLPFLDDLLPLHISVLATIEHDILERFSFHIYTKEQDQPCFERHPNIEKLRRLMPVTAHPVPLDNTGSKFYYLVECYEYARITAIQDVAVMLCLQPDLVIPAGAFLRLLALHEKGFHYVLAFGLPVCMESFLIQARNQSTSLAGRSFVQLCLNNTHPDWSNHYWETGFYYDGVDFLCWPLPNQQGFLIRSLLLYPILIDPLYSPEVSFYWTPDVEYVYRAARGDMRQVYIFQDAEELLIASLAPRHELRWSKQRTDGLEKTDYIAKWAQLTTDAFHREFFKQRFFLHGHDLDDSIAPVVDESDQIIQRILHKIDALPNRYQEVIALAKNRTIAIFGAGSFGQLVSRALLVSGAEPAVFFDNDATKWGQRFGPIPVIAPEADSLTRYFVVIASMWFENLRTQLNDCHLTEGLDYVVIKPTDIWKTS